MKKRKPVLESITPAFGSSFSVRTFETQCEDSKPGWHFHPEMELVYIKGGSGKRHIGSHLSCFHDGDLVLLGPNLPHFGFTDRLTGHESEVVAQMRSDFLGENFLEIPEMAPIRNLFERAKFGIAFQGAIKDQLGERLEKLEQMEGVERLLEFISILDSMANTPDYLLLNVDSYPIEVTPQDNERINQVYCFVQENFDRTISLEEVATDVNMTVPAFCRYFKKQSGKTFVQFVNEYRIVQACKKLSETSMSISEIALDSGFNNFSHFNRLFKEITDQSPSAYRKKIRQLIK